MPPVDVTIITPVHNTGGYLRRWYDSLLAQSIGTGRFEVVAVDDGSDDDSLRRLEGLAAEHPGLLTVLRLPDRGGPARARNLALERAAGRYLYFVDSDDHLGPEALERAVGFADRHGSDVVLARMVGENGRKVAQWLYRETVVDEPFPGPLLPWSLNVTKLYRRELVERYRLRFREDLPVYSDQPFALEAYARAGRISVYADYPCYHLTRRDDGSNITLTADPEDRLRAIEAIMATTPAFAEPGPGRAEFFRRHLQWELLPLVGPAVLGLDPAVRRRLLRGAGRLLAQHCGDWTGDGLAGSQLRRARLLQDGLADDYLELLRHEAEHGTPPPPLRVTSVGWQPPDRPGTGPSLTLSAVGRGSVRARLLQLPGGPPAVLPRPRSGGGAAQRVERAATVTGPAGAGARSLPEHTVSLPLAALLPRRGTAAGSWSVLLEAEYAGPRDTLAVPAPTAPLPSQRMWHRGVPYRASTQAGPDGALTLVLTRDRISLRRAAGWGLRRARRRLRAVLPTRDPRSRRLAEPRPPVEPGPLSPPAGPVPQQQRPPG
ncbi:glycosyl transferase family 2 [Streptomyces sp. 846.5]|nr:glycosyl transferase family 2 [Streptomyces sp. 846.5]